LKIRSESKVAGNGESNSTERVHYGSIEIKKNQVGKTSMTGAGGRNFSSRQEAVHLRLMGRWQDSLIEMYGVKDAVQVENK